MNYQKYHVINTTFHFYSNHIYIYKVGLSVCSCLHVIKEGGAFYATCQAFFKLPILFSPSIRVASGLIVYLGLLLYHYKGLGPGLSRNCVSYRVSVWFYSF